jgi:two-component system response regulator TtrR
MIKDAKPIVYIVDDEESIRDSIKWLLESLNIPSEAFSSAQEFLNLWNTAWEGCALLDVRMPGISGMELLEKLEARGNLMPVIIVTGHGDIAMAVRALKHGALDFIQKPFNSQDLLDKVQAAMALDHANRHRHENTVEQHLMEALSKREREVMALLVAGNSSKDIAKELGISNKTVDAHRASILHKLNARNFIEAVRLWVTHQA